MHCGRNLVISVSLFSNETEEINSLGSLNANHSPKLNLKTSMC